MNLAQIVQSNALSFFHLSSPDLLFGFDADPLKRNIIGVAQADPQLARDGVGVRRFGQQIIEWLGGKRIHPAWVVPGGVDAPLSADTRDRILSTIPEAIAAIERALAWYKSSLLRWEDEAASFGDFRSAFMGLVDDAGNVDYYDGRLRVMDADGHLLADRIDPRSYQDYLGEAVEPWSYLKSTYWKVLGYPEGVYRVGPLARVIVAAQMGTPRADLELDEFRRRLGRVPSSSFHYHYARLIDTLHAAERIDELLRGPDILSPRVRSFAEVNANEGIGVSEAPRGTLIHHYRVDDDGIVQWANLVIATGHNNLAMNRSVRQVAQRYVKSAQLTRADAQPGRGGHPLLRPMPVVLDARPGRDGAASPAHRPGRRRAGRDPAVTHGALIIGYGNVLRSDDGIGWHVAEHLAADARFDGVTVLQRHQLTPELALDVSRADLVALVDATQDRPAGTFAIERLAAIEDRHHDLEPPDGAIRPSSPWPVSCTVGRPRSTCSASVSRRSRSATGCRRRWKPRSCRTWSTPWPRWSPPGRGARRRSRPAAMHEVSLVAELIDECQLRAVGPACPARPRPPCLEHPGAGAAAGLPDADPGRLDGRGAPRGRTVRHPAPVRLRVRWRPRARRPDRRVGRRVSGLRRCLDPVANRRAGAHGDRDRP